MEIEGKIHAHGFVSDVGPTNVVSIAQWFVPEGRDLVE